MDEPRFAKYFPAFQWPWHMPTIDEYGMLIRRLPFRGPRLWVENADRLFPDVDAMIRWIDQPCLVPFLPNVPHADRPAFRAEVIERMVRATRQPTGQCFEQFRRLQFSGHV